MKKVTAFLMVSMFTVAVYGQESVEFTVAYGGTVVDLDELVDIDENENTSVTDWNTENIGFSAQLFFKHNDKIGFGGELMYQHLYWYSVRVPYGYQPIYREYSVSTLRMTPMIRFGINGPLSLDAGLEFNFMDPINVGLMFSGNYYIPVNEKIDIPLKIRFDLFNNIVFTSAISFNLGLRFKL